MEHEINSIAILTIAPSGHLHVVSHIDNGNGYSEVHDQPIMHAFMQSQEQGLLQLLTTKIDNNWSLSMKYWRNFIAQYMDQLCHYTNSEHQLDEPIKAPNEEHLQEWLLKMPPMPGGEYGTTVTLSSIWSTFDNWCRIQIASEPEGVAGFLFNHLPEWQHVGRVCFHLAENQQDPEYPFAFIATYAASITGQREVQHKQLCKALQDYAGHTNKQALYNLLKPIHEAAKLCVWVREVLESYDIYHPMAWTPSEAYQLLQSIPQLESCGLVVKCPNWWKKRSKPKVQVTLGNKKNTLLGGNSI